MEPRPTRNFLISGFLFLVLCLVDYEGAAAGGSRTPMHSTCNGSIAQCNIEGELLMESDISRRTLAEQDRFIYSSLRANGPACPAGPGNPYSGCLPQKSNPPGRSCSAHYRCRGSPSNHDY